MKPITFIKTCLLAILLIGVGSNKLKAEGDPYIYSTSYVFSDHFTNGQTIGNGSIDHFISYTSAKNSSSTVPTYYDTGSAVRVYGHNNEERNGGEIVLIPNEGITITKVIINASQITETTYSIDGGNEITIAWDNNSVTIDGVEAKVSFKIQNRVNATTQVRISSFDITYSSNEQLCTPPNLNFSHEQVTRSIVEESFTMEATSDNKTTPITYSSSNEDVAEVDASGKVTLKAVGTSIITASQEAGTHDETEYCADEAQYTLTVEPLAAPVAIAASEISTSGFTANWEQVEHATNYELSVYEKIVESNPELVTNGGFEAYGLSGWTFENDMNQTRSDEQVHSGTYSLKVSVYDTKKIKQNLVVENGKSYQLTMWYFLDENSTGSGWRVWTTVGADFKVPSESSFFNTKGSWQKVEHEFIVTADNMIFEIRVYNGATLYLDDISIKQKEYHSITGSPFDNIHTTSKALSGLSSGTTYYYTVKAKANGYESAVSNEIKLVTERRNIVSTATGNWNDASTWVNQEIPGLYDNITIANGHTVSINQSGASCYDLTINNGATLDIHADADLIVENDLVNGGDLNLKSSAIGTASLLHNTNDVSATMDRYISGSWAWHLLGSPVAAQSIDNDWTPDGQENDYDFYAYDEATATWLNQKVGENGLNSFIPGQGYLIAYEANDPTKPFIGELNNQEVEIAIYKNGSGKFAGYNLLANPYPSGINWNLADRSLFEDDFVYVYNAVKDGGEGYETIDGGEANAFIAPHQGFFVLAKQTATFTFTNYLRQHGGSYFKSSSASLLALRLSNDSYYDLTRIRIREGSRPERDRSDALKFYSLDYRVPQLYSISEDQVPLMLNSYPFIKDEMAVELGLLIPSEGTYTLAVAEAEGVFDGVSLYVYDKLLDKRHDLSDEGAYSFSADPQDDPMRFTLYFGTVGIEVQSVRDKLHAFVGNGYLNLHTDQASQLDILDIQGRLIQRVQLSGQGLERIPINLSKGVYLLQLTDNYKVRAAKVLVP
ncbi:MAG: carbohydrate binding domain-containing protein [Bacteroidales bacterium]|jgi:hypothetical protein|nr:carbohydrate binding domain-containing protein [Bacteroidales bacterium]MDY0370452.1 carbohydrate binding domain-containing protein [Bacteroidales bacterium]